MRIKNFLFTRDNDDDYGWRILPDEISDAECNEILNYCDICSQIYLDKNEVNRLIVGISSDDKLILISPTLTNKNDPFGRSIISIEGCILSMKEKKNVLKVPDVILQLLNRCKSMRTMFVEGRDVYETEVDELDISSDYGNCNSEILGIPHFKKLVVDCVNGILKNGDNFIVCDIEERNGLLERIAEMHSFQYIYQLRDIDFDIEQYISQVHKNPLFTYGRNFCENNYNLAINFSRAGKKERYQWKLYRVNDNSLISRSIPNNLNNHKVELSKLENEADKIEVFMGLCGNRESKERR